MAASALRADSTLSSPLVLSDQLPKKSDCPALVQTGLLGVLSDLIKGQMFQPVFLPSWFGDGVGVAHCVDCQGVGI